MSLFLTAGDTWIEMCRRQVDVLEFKDSDYRHRKLGVTAYTALSSRKLCPVVTRHLGLQVLSQGD